MKKMILQSFLRFAILSVLTGIAYPVLIWGLGQVAYPWQAGGSLLTQDGQVVASRLIGQHFTDSLYFHGRPSMTSDEPYNAQASGGSNLAQSNPVQQKWVVERREVLCSAHDCSAGDPPEELLQASASGLDPDISVAAALFQSVRVARARHLPVERVSALIHAAAIPPFLGYFGTERVNVVQLNRELDRISR